VAQEAERLPYKFSPERQKYWLEQQEKFGKRIDARNKRATRSICDDFCKETRRPNRAEPDDPLAPLPGEDTGYEGAPMPGGVPESE
jgi:hypothetical protein